MSTPFGFCCVLINFLNKWRREILHYKKSFFWPFAVRHVSAVMWAQRGRSGCCEMRISQRGHAVHVATGPCGILATSRHVDDVEYPCHPRVSDVARTHVATWLPMATWIWTTSRQSVTWNKSTWIMDKWLPVATWSKSTSPLSSTSPKIGKLFNFSF